MMFKSLLLIALTVLSCQAFPRYQRLRREAESGRSTSCKNTYDQCPEWKGEGMCTSEQYKDYMMTVCPVTCEFCKENHVRDEIEEPEDTSANLFKAPDSKDAAMSQEDDSATEEESGSGSGSEGESGSGSSNDTAKKENIQEDEEGASEEESGQSEESKEDDETPDTSTATTAAVTATKANNKNEETEEEEEEEVEEDAKPIQSAKQEKMASKFNKGAISVLLRQPFKSDFTNKDSAPFRMLSGNVLNDFQKALKAKVTDVTFSEGNVEGNPRQTGKTKMTFSISGDDQEVLKKLASMVNTDQNVNGLSVYSGSLEYDE